MQAIMIQAHILYSGTVQGVGFRFTIQRFAAELGLKGWVKNLRDGRVEIMAQGKKELIEKLMEGTEKYFDGYIRNKEVFYPSLEEDFSDFQITN